MTRVLLFASAIISLAAVVFGFLNHGKLQATRIRMEASAQQLAEKQAALDIAQKDVQLLRKENKEVADQRDKLAAGFGDSKEELTKIFAALDAEKAKVVATDEARASAELRLREALDQMATYDESQPSAEAASINELNELRALVATLQELVAKQAKLIEQLKGSKPSGAIPQGTVLAVNRAWNFVVLNLGRRQGIAQNTEMLVQRGNQLIGKVRVTSVETSTSIADIVVRSIPRGLSVMPGDAVIQQAKPD